MRVTNPELVSFRQFLAFKIGAPFVFAHGLTLPTGLLPLGIGLAIFLASLRKHYLLGLFGILCVSGYENMASWPFTINHTWLEFMIVALLLLEPTTNQEEERFSTINMMKILMASVWFYAGVHKILHGYYVNGEFFGLEALGGTSTLGRNLRLMIQFFETLFGNTVELIPFQCCTNATLSVPHRDVMFLLGLSWSTIAMELLLPFTLFFRRTRELGVFAIIVCQIMIGIFSGEIDFAFTAVAIFFLFLPRVAWLTHPALAALFLAVCIWK